MQRERDICREREKEKEKEDKYITYESTNYPSDSPKGAEREKETEKERAINSRWIERGRERDAERQTRYT